MVRIAERIWAAGREQLERGHEPSLRLLLVPAADRPDLTDALRGSLWEVQRERSDPSWTGEWNWVHASDGVLVQVTDCDEFDTVLRGVAAALERRDVAGSFDLHEDAAIATLPRSAHMIECRIRVRGTRVRRAPQAYLWEADPEAHEALLAVAERWCRRDRAGASLNVSTVGPVAVEPGEDVLETMHEAVRDRMQVELWSVTSDELRSVAARAWTGGVSLVRGGAWIEGGHWQRAVAELTDLLRAHADQVAYGFVRRGWAVAEALLENELPRDWPRRADREPRAFNAMGYARESE